jgi:ABC-type branched-subunit amino acid transport system substrate-binding protein
VAAAGPVRLGVAAGVSGYLANIDRGWRDGVLLAAEKVNRDGGVLGRQLEVVVEDMRSEPQPMVTAVNKLIVSDGVSTLLNGCSSAGNGAAAPVATRASVPMILCSIIPPDPRPEDARWLFSTLPRPLFEVMPRLAYLSARTPIRKIGLIYDPTPYASLQKRLAEAEAPKLGFTIVGVEQYKVQDTDLSIQLQKLRAAGAEAVLKMGAGPSTITAAKNMRQLGMSVPLMSSVEDLAVFRQAAEALDTFFFVASPPQVYEALPDSAPTKRAIRAFLELWQAKHGERDPSWGGRGWDALHMVVEAIKRAGAPDGPKVRDALEGIAGFHGTSAIYTFSPDSHYGIRENPIVLARITGGKVTIVK